MTCDVCSRWFHAKCAKAEDQVDAESWLCERCSPEEKDKLKTASSSESVSEPAVPPQTPAPPFRDYQAVQKLRACTSRTALVRHGLLPLGGESKGMEIHCTRGYELCAYIRCQPGKHHPECQGYCGKWRDEKARELFAEFGNRAPTPIPLDVHPDGSVNHYASLLQMLGMTGSVRREGMPITRGS